jgi:hypothetical protein
MTLNVREATELLGKRFSSEFAAAPGENTHSPSCGRDHIDDAYLWYEAQQAGLGEVFLRAADEVIKAVVANPLQFPVIHSGGVPGFGYFIFVFLGQRCEFKKQIIQDTISD